MYDIAIVGSGFGGSLLAMIACRLGLSVLLLEKGKHPRFVIGESTAPLTNLLIEEMAHRYDLPGLLPLTSFGPWQRTYPDITCGLKRGFTYYHQVAGQEFVETPDRARQLLVAASPNDELADTHWLRADVDHFFVREAVRVGVTYHDQAQLAPPVRNADDTWTLHWNASRAERTETASARLLIDATGPRGYLSQALGIAGATFCNYPPTQALFSHFRGVGRCDGMPEYATDEELPPYLPDDAALHHVFDGGWMWVLRFGNGVTSAGFALTDAVAAEIGLPDREGAWKRLMARFPTVGAQFAEAEACFPLVHLPRLSYRAEKATGEGWAMLPSAAAFIDPLFSTGFPLTLLGVERLSRILEESWGKTDFHERLQAYGETTLTEVDATADFISGCYAAMERFSLFIAYSQFYFAAASYSEMARRLGKRHLVRRFLATDHPHFGKALHEHAHWLRQNGRTATPDDIAAFARKVSADIACLNIAGLSDPLKRNWYGVDLNDVIVGAEKLTLTPQEMREVLAVAPWAQMA